MVRQREVRQLESWLAWWVGLTGLYLLFAGTLNAQEIAAGLVAAAIAATGVTAAGRSEEPWAYRWSWLRKLLRLLWEVPRDAVRVSRAAWRAVVLRQPIEGRFEVVPFEPGGDDPHSATRRALVTIGISLPPNSFVIDIDRQHSSILVHKLVPAPPGAGQRDKEWP
jgi:multisubunit Na+/H+ antiporter MnhE subunit